MAFSWKQEQKNAILKKKKRRQVLLKHGDTTQAAETERDIKRLENNA